MRVYVFVTVTLLLAICLIINAVPVDEVAAEKETPEKKQIGNPKISAGNNVQADGMTVGGGTSGDNLSRNPGFQKLVDDLPAGNNMQVDAGTRGETSMENTTENATENTTENATENTTENTMENTTENLIKMPSVMPPIEMPSIMPPFQKCGRSDVLKAMLEAKQEDSSVDGDDDYSSGSGSSSFERDETMKVCIPWQVRLRISGYYYCGGSIISDRHILTAAHCLQKACYPEDVKVTLVGRRSDVKKYKGRELSVQNMTVHPDYCPYTNVSNIAVLTLQDPIAFNTPCVGEICRDPRCQFDGRICYVSGWRSKNLQVVKVKTHDGLKCARTFQINNPYYIYDKKTMICAGNTEGDEDSCKGDLGDPLVCLDRRTKSFIQVGIASHGDRCGKRPGVYTKLACFEKWIRRIMLENRPCITIPRPTKPYEPYPVEPIPIETTTGPDQILE